MIHEQTAPSQDVAELWRERFGQPPPILAEPELMLQILRAAPEPRAEPRSWSPDEGEA